MSTATELLRRADEICSRVWDPKAEELSEDIRAFLAAEEQYDALSERYVEGFGNSMKACKESFEREAERVKELLAAEPEAEQEPAAWMFPDDLERFQTDETFAQAFSVKCGSPTQGITLPLFLNPPKSIEAIDRNKIVEECARACENAMPSNPISGAVIDRCAEAIRGLKK